MKVNLEERNGELVPISIEAENDKDVEFLLNQLRPKGRWKEYKLRNDIVVEYAFRCSNCKKDSGLLYRTDFCPNCGADMRGSKEE